MFTDEDCRHVFMNYSPSISKNGLPSLVLAASGQGFITLHQILVEFERRMTEETKQVPIVDLAHSIDIEPTVVLQLIQSQPHLALLGTDSHNAIPKAERDTIRGDLSKILSERAVSRKDFASQSGIDPKSLDLLLEDVEEELVHYDDLVCTVAYDKELSYDALGTINRATNNRTNIDLRPSDLAQLPGSPPKWLELHHLERHMKESPERENDVFIKDMPDFIRIQSKHFRADSIKIWTRYLETGEDGYIDLHAVMESCNALYDTLSDVVLEYQKVPNLEVINEFAISEVFFEKLVVQKLKALHWEETGVIDVAKDLRENFQVPEHHQMGITPYRKIPENLYAHLERKVERHLETFMAQHLESDHRRFGTIILTNETYTLSRAKVLEQASENATSQWQQLHNDPNHEIKFNAQSTTDETDLQSKLLSALSTEKATQKESEAHFWASIAALETSNEVSFSTFWTERVDARTRIYNTGLSNISDAKLREQLSELFAVYVQKELVPESIAKARAQHLLLSRRTKKNVARLEVTLAAAKSEADAVLSTLDKFGKKEGVEVAHELDDAKKSMVQDMLRRMQKLQKGSDGPVLFLTLVVLLFGKYFEGVVYATGKYAPKLLKLLKEKMEPEEYARVEKWKEAAKSGSLTAEDREEMRVMAAA